MFSEPTQEANDVACDPVQVRELSESHLVPCKTQSSNYTKVWLLRNVHSRGPSTLIKMHPPRLSLPSNPGSCFLPTTLVLPDACCLQ